VILAIRRCHLASVVAAVLLGCVQPSPTPLPGSTSSPLASPSPALPASPPQAASAEPSSPAPTAPLPDVDFFVSALARFGLPAPCPCPDVVTFHRVGRKLIVQVEGAYFQISPNGQNLSRLPAAPQGLPDNGLVSPQSAGDGTLWVLRDKDKPAPGIAQPTASQLLRRLPSGEWAQARLHYPSGSLDDVILSDLLVDESSVWVAGFSLARPNELVIWVLRAP